MKINVTNNPSGKDPLKWSNKDIVIYFSNRMHDRTGHELIIPQIAWSGFVGRVKGFRERMGITTQQYKEFIDDVFDLPWLKSDERTPVFGCIVSIKVFYLIQRYKQRQPEEVSDTYWRELASQMHHNSTLFKHIAQDLKERGAKNV